MPTTCGVILIQESVFVDESTSSQWNWQGLLYKRCARSVTWRSTNEVCTRAGGEVTAVKGQSCITRSTEKIDHCISKRHSRHMHFLTILLNMKCGVYSLSYTFFFPSSYLLSGLSWTERGLYNIRKLGEEEVRKEGEEKKSKEEGRRREKTKKKKENNQDGRVVPWQRRYMRRRVAGGVVDPREVNAVRIKKQLVVGQWRVYGNLTHPEQVDNKNTDACTNCTHVANIIPILRFIRNSFHIRLIELFNLQTLFGGTLNAKWDTAGTLRRGYSRFLNSAYGISEPFIKKRASRFLFYFSAYFSHDAIDSIPVRHLCCLSDTF